MPDNYIHSSINLGNFEIPIFIISLQSDTFRRSLLLEYFSKKIISNYFPASDFRNKSEFELDQLMDVTALVNNKNYNRKLTGGEIGCADSHKSVYQYMKLNNLPLALIIEDDVIAHKKWEIKLEKIIKDIMAIDKDLPFICNIGIENNISVPKKTIFTSILPLIFLRNIKLVDFSKSDLWLTHSYLINLKGAENILNNHGKNQVACDDWKFFYQKKILHFVFISDCIFIQNPTLDSNIREREINKMHEINSNNDFQLLISVKVFIKIIFNNLNPKNWKLIRSNFF